MSKTNAPLCPRSQTVSHGRNRLSAGLALGSARVFAQAARNEPTTQNSSGRLLHLRETQGPLVSHHTGRPAFLPLGLNHIDPASLRYPENLEIWKESRWRTIKWIEESVAPNLQAWGFNTVGWVQEVTVRQWRHSRAFTIDEYRALDTPYCHLLPFIESHQWEKQHRSL